MSKRVCLFVNIMHLWGRRNDFFLGAVSSFFVNLDSSSRFANVIASRMWSIFGLKIWTVGRPGRLFNNFRAGTVIILVLSISSQDGPISSDGIT